MLSFLQHVTKVAQGFTDRFVALTERHTLINAYWILPNARVVERSEETILEVATRVRAKFQN